MDEKQLFPSLRVFRWMVLVQVLCGSGAIADAEGKYVVRQMHDGSPDLEITFELPQGGQGMNRKLFARGVAWGLQEQIRAPRCVGGPMLTRDDDGHWIAPPGCSQVTWVVSPTVMKYGVVDASAQASVFLSQPAWTLLSEPTSLLRVMGAPARQDTLRAGDGGTHLLGATPMKDGAWRVPADNNAPEFYIAGRAQVEHQQVGGFSVSYVSDDPRRVARLGLTASHAEALRYLVRVVYGDTEVSEKDRSLLVVWLGIDAQHGRVGGAAGSRSFVTNYLIGDEKDIKSLVATTLMILAHEQFHQLVDARRGELPALPAWINESLAQCYGLQAMQKAMQDKIVSDKLIQRFIDSDRMVEQGLIGVEAIFDSDRSRATDLAYRQGATFWAELDRILRLVSDGAASLEEYIPSLMRMDFPENGSLPDAFLAQLHRWHDDRIEQIIRKYVDASDGAAGSGD